MDTWETFFSEKSKRRWARHSRERYAKAAVLALLLSSVAVAIFLMVTGVPR